MSEKAARGASGAGDCENGKTERKLGRMSVKGELVVFDESGYDLLGWREPASLGADAIFVNIEALGGARGDMRFGYSRAFKTGAWAINVRARVGDVLEFRADVAVGERESDCGLNEIAFGNIRGVKNLGESERFAEVAR